jgi:hypothetical protein
MSIAEPGGDLTRRALCPDGVARPYRVTAGAAIIDLRGKTLRGSVSIEAGVSKFRALARHHAAHRMWHFDPRAHTVEVDPKSPIDRLESVGESDAGT